KRAGVASFAGETFNTADRQSSAAARPTIASADPRPIDEDAGRTASVREATEGAPTIRGVTGNEIRLGISAPFTGSAKELGNQMKLGIQIAFNLINDSGREQGRGPKIGRTD